MSKSTVSIGGSVSGTGVIVAGEVNDTSIAVGSGQGAAGGAAAGAPGPAKGAKRSSGEGAPTHDDLSLKPPKAERIHEVEDSLLKAASKGVLLAVVTDVELYAVLRHMAPLPGRNAVVRVQPGVDQYWVGKYGSYAAVLVRTKMGPMGAALSVQDAVRVWDPRAVVSVGIAFGLKPGPEKQCLGDVLVTDRVAAYDLVRVTGPEMKETPRGAIQAASPILLEAFKSENEDWEFCDSNSKNRRKAKVFPGLWLSGSRLLDSAAKAKEMLGGYPCYKEAVGGEMEACGIMAACTRARKEWLVVKGICDFAGLDGEKKKGAQPFAAAAAASLVKHVFEGHPFRGLGCVRLPDAAKANVADEGGAGKPKPDGEV